MNRRELLLLLGGALIAARDRRLHVRVPKITTGLGRTLPCFEHKPLI
jgi:hypothetical protein